MPVALGRAHVSPVCRDLVRAHPKVSVDLMLTDRLVELIDEGMDVVVRIGAPKDSGQIPKWPTGADCKSAGLRLRWFESSSAHHLQSFKTSHLQINCALSH